MTRTEALRAAGAVIARSVPNLDELEILLRTAGQSRLAEAITARRAERMPAIGEGCIGNLDVALWNQAAEHLIAGDWR